MTPLWRARLAALIVGAAAVASALWAAWAVALGLGAIALVLLVLVTDRGVPEALPQAAAQGSLAAVAVLTRALHLGGRGIVLPGRTRQAPSRLLLPVEDAPLAMADAADPDIVLQREAERGLGVVLPPPGEGLEARWRDLHGLPQGAGLEEAAQHLRAAFPALGLGDEVVVARSEGRVRVAYRATSFADACRRAREEDAPWHLQGGCPACSFAAILVARGAGAAVKVSASGNDGSRSWIELEVAPRSPP